GVRVGPLELHNLAGHGLGSRIHRGGMMGAERSDREQQTKNCKKRQCSFHTFLNLRFLTAEHNDFALGQYNRSFSNGNKYVAICRRSDKVPAKAMGGSPYETRTQHPRGNGSVFGGSGSARGGNRTADSHL